MSTINPMPKLSLIEKIDFILHRVGLINAFKNKSFINTKAIGIDASDIINILNTFPRQKWYSIIKQLIWVENKKDHYCVVNNDKFNNYPIALDDFILEFNLKDLSIDKFDIEPGKSYTHSKFGGICYVYDYLPLDIRSKYNSCGDKIVFNGNIPDCIGISDTGEFYDTYIVSTTYSDASYHNYKEVNYTPIQGEALYYIKQIVDNKITDQEKIDKFIYYLSVSNKKFPIGDTSNKDKFESIFM